MLEFIASRLKERTTWMGIIGLATAAGLNLSPEYIEAIIATGISLASLIAVFTADRKKEAPKDEA